MARTPGTTRLRRRNVIFASWAVVIQFWAISTPAAAASNAKSAFFATRSACVASGKFDRRECDNAFSNAFAQMRVRRLVFTSKIECAIRFRLCERPDNASGDAGLFGPVMLGVEIVPGRGGAAATPVFAVENPHGLFAPTPIRVAWAAPNGSAPATERADLPTDHFATVDPRGVRAQWAHFQPRRLVVHASARENFGSDRESEEARRARLREAPFVQ